MDKFDIHAQLEPEFRDWFIAEVERGRFPSVEAGLNTIFGWFKHEADASALEDFSWVAPLLDEADQDRAAGHLRSAELVHAELRQRLLDSLK